MRRSTYILPILVLAVAGLLSAIFIVDEREKVLVLQFGKVVSTNACTKLGTSGFTIMREIRRSRSRSQNSASTRATDAIWGALG